MTRIAGTGSSNRIFDGQRKDFIVMRKDTFSYNDTYEYVTDNGVDAEYDFTGCVGAMQIKKKKSDTAVVRTVSVRFSTTTYYLSADADDMDMDAGKYYYDLQIYDADSEMVTKLYGDFIVLQDVTSMDIPASEGFSLDMDTAVTYEEGKVIREKLLMDNEVTYTMGEKLEYEQKMLSLVAYTFGLKESEEVVMSSSVAYQMMTIWEKDELMMTTVATYLIGHVATYECIMQTSLTYILFETP